MRGLSGAALAAVIALGGCNQGMPADTSPSAHRGRYTGIGIYSADPLWSHMRVYDKPRDGAAATTADDQAIIVVVDGDTGEVRQCGNMSGYCVGMNPWAGSLGKARSAPATLDKHRADLGDGEAVISNQVEPSDEAAPPP